MVQSTHTTNVTYQLVRVDHTKLELLDPSKPNVRVAKVLRRHRQRRGTYAGGGWGAGRAAHCCCVCFANRPFPLSALAPWGKSEATVPHAAAEPVASRPPAPAIEARRACSPRGIFTREKILPPAHSCTLLSQSVVPSSSCTLALLCIRLAFLGWTLSLLATGRLLLATSRLESRSTLSSTGISSSQHQQLAPGQDTRPDTSKSGRRD